MKLYEAVNAAFSYLIKRLAFSERRRIAELERKVFEKETPNPFEKDDFTITPPEKSRWF